MGKMNSYLGNKSTRLLVFTFALLLHGTARAEVIQQLSSAIAMDVELGAKVGQSFTPTTSGSITQVGLNTNGGEFRIWIHRGASTTGTQLYYDPLTVISVAGVNSVKMYTLDTPVPVTAGQVYTVVAMPANFSYGTRKFGRGSGDVYAGGTGYYSVSGTPANIGADLTFKVVIEDLTAPTIAAVTTVSTPTTDTTPSYTFSSNEAGTISYGGSCSSSATSAVNGNNTVTFNALSDGTYSNCTIRVTDAAGNASSALTVNSFTIDTTAPALSQVTAVPAATNDNTPNYTFYSSEAGNITYAGSCSSSKSSAIKGNNLVTFNSLPDGTYSNCSIRVTDGLGHVSSALSVNSFVVDTVAPGTPTGTLMVDENSASATPVGTVSGGGDATYSLTNTAGGRFAISTGGNVTVANGSQLDYETSSSHNITVRARDAAGNTTDAVLVVTINDVNEAPVIGGSPATSVEAYSPYSFTPSAADPEGVALTFSINNKPLWAAFDAATGTLSGTPDNSHVGTTSNIVINVSDGVFTTPLASFAVEVAENLDIDGDGMPNDWELANGFDPLDPNDANGDADGDGLTNLEEYLGNTAPLADDNPPVVTAPADVITGSTALFTEVELGVATAFDDKDGALTPVADIRFFAPGLHTITWSATDAAGNIGNATQTVSVEPQVSFDKEQVTAEGGTVAVRAILNGPAANYPVTIPYTVTGTASADGSDHNLVDGEITITSGTVGTLSFDTIDDGAGEGDETIVITMGTPVNSVVGANAVDTITITEGNVAPLLSLVAEQDTLPTRMVAVGEGPVIIRSSVVDANGGDSHLYDWSASDNVLVDLDGTSDTFTFDPYGLNPGVYTVHLAVSDGTDTSTASIKLNVVTHVPKLVGYLDRDGDGADDASEGYGDSDNDGIADYLDPVAASNVLPGKSNNSDSNLVETEVGLQLLVGELALFSNLGQAGISLDLLRSVTGLVEDEDYLYNNGLFDFIVSGLPTAGQSVQVVLPQLAPIPRRAAYRKAMDGQWQNFVVNANNQVASAHGAEGYCPSPGDSAYEQGLQAGYWCVQLTIEDGGPNDADGTANNRVVDPGGVGASTAEVHSGSSGGATSLFWLVALLALTQRKRRKREHR